jgi:nitric oxide dioxygenase
MLTPEERAAIKRSWEIVGARGAALAEVFYQRLFEIAPHYRRLFASDLGPQQRKLFAMLQLIVRALDWPEQAWSQSVPVDDDPFLVILELGRRHAERYHVPDTAYDDVNTALLATLETGLGRAFTPEVRAAWTRLYALIAKTMKMGRCAVGDGSEPDADA